MGSASCLRVVVASGNQVKINAVRSAFLKTFNRQFVFEGVKVSSAVADQPFGDEETLLGARNRARNAAVLYPRALCVAIEGGVRQACFDKRHLECFAWAVVLNPLTGVEGTAQSASFMLPPAISQLVKGGMELGDADDQVFGRRNSGSGSGTVGVLTGGLITRTDYYHHVVSLALIPFMNPEHYEANMDNLDHVDRL